MTRTFFAGVVVVSLALSLRAGAQDSFHERVFEPLPSIPGNEFGADMDVDGELVLVGAPFGFNSFGDAYLFRRQPDASWLNVGSIGGPTALASNSRFGSAVELDGARVAIGAPLADTANVNDVGAFVIYRLELDGSLTEESTHFAPDSATGDRFGAAIALEGDRLVVGAPDDDDQGVNSGSVYVFERGVTGWTLSAKVKPFLGAASLQFGFNVALDGDRMLVATKSTIAGPYVFELTPQGAWAEVGRLPSHPSGNANGELGASMQLVGDTAVVGSPLWAPFGSFTQFGSALIAQRTPKGPWVLTATLQAIDIEAGDRFGASVDIDGDVVIVGAPGGDDIGGSSGSAYVFERNQGGVWTEVRKLTTLGSSPGAALGTCVALSGPSILCGAPGKTAGFASLGGQVRIFERRSLEPAHEDETITSIAQPAGLGLGTAVRVDGDRAVIAAAPSPSGDNGRVFVFERDPAGQWSQVADILAAVGHGNFGRSVAIEGDRMVVGQPSFNFNMHGLVHVYERDTSGQWGLVASLQRNPPAGEILSGHGSVVALDGDRLVTSAFSTFNPLSVCVWERSVSGVWIPVALPVIPVSGPSYGCALDVEGERLVVALRENVGSPTGPGVVHVFERTSLGSWGVVAEIRPSNGLLGDTFGQSLDLEGDRLVVGAINDDDFGTSSGSAFIFERQPNGAWLEVAKLRASDGTSGDEFGSFVDVRGDRLLVGASKQSDQGTFNGAAYLFERRASGSWVEVVKFSDSRNVSNNELAVAGALGDDYVLLGAPKADGQFVSDVGRALAFDLGSLYHGAPALSLAAGDAQALLLRAGPAYAGHFFLMLGSATGTTPGIDVPGTNFVLPLVQDAYFDLLLGSGGARLLFPWVGVLDADGSANARFDVPTGASASAAGLVLQHACAFIDPTTFEFSGVSNAVEVELVP